MLSKLQKFKVCLQYVASLRYFKNALSLLIFIIILYYWLFTIPSIGNVVIKIDDSEIGVVFQIYRGTRSLAPHNSPVIDSAKHQPREAQVFLFMVPWPLKKSIIF